MGFNILLILLSLCNFIIILKEATVSAIDFILPEGEEQMNIQFLQMKLASGRYKTKAADYSHNVQSNLIKAMGLAHKRKFMNG